MKDRTRSDLILDITLFSNEALIRELKLQFKFSMSLILKVFD